MAQKTKAVSRSKNVKSKELGTGVKQVSPKRFSIVGIGASAGGLEALELFLANALADSGMVFVQTPDSAKLVDVLVEAQELPARISSILHHIPLLTNPDPLNEDQAKSSLEKVVIILRAQTGHDFSLYKKTRSTGASSGGLAYTTWITLPPMFRQNVCRVSS
jgi:hypothetical protein